MKNRVIVIVKDVDVFFVLRVNLLTMTNKKLIDKVMTMTKGMLPHDNQTEYFILRKNMFPICGVGTLYDLGFRYGDVICVISERKGVSCCRNYSPEINELIDQIITEANRELGIWHKREISLISLLLSKINERKFSIYGEAMKEIKRLQMNILASSRPFKDNMIQNDSSTSYSFEPVHHEWYKTEQPVVSASLYAPSQIKRGIWGKIQVFLYKDSEFDEVEKKASTVDPSAKIMTYTPLDMNLSAGDVVDIKLHLYNDGVRVPLDKNRVVWQGGYKSCEFVFQVPIDSAVESVAGEAEISINGIQIGKLVFIINVVDEEPVSLYTEVLAKPYKKVFISYSHKDKKTADIVAKTCMAQQLDYFFDRHTLKPGDDFDGKITQYIQSADLFILCWSENAAKSEYVRKEYTQAVELSELKKRPSEASLRICPFNIDPKANPPVEMAKLHFEEL